MKNYTVKEKFLGKKIQIPGGLVVDFGKATDEKIDALRKRFPKVSWENYLAIESETTKLSKEADTTAKAKDAESKTTKPNKEVVSDK